MSERRLDQAVAAALFLTSVVVIGLASTQVGFTRDEGYYFKAGEEYWGWFVELWRDFARLELTRPFTQAVVDKHWTYNHEHPGLVKTTFALSYGILKEGLGLFSSTATSIRFPAWIFAGLSVVFTFGLARELLPRRAAALAALLWLSLPHVFWHMQLACFDVPVCTAHVGLVWAYWRWRRTWRGALLVGVAFGLAAGVKHNAVLVPGVLFLHWLVVEARGLALIKDGLKLPPVPVVFLSLAFVGPVVYFLHWPWLWPDPLPRIGAYLGYMLRHEDYPILYFGDLLTRPPFPWSFPFVMSAVTLPVPALVLMVTGFALACVVAGRELVARLRGRPAPVEVVAVSLTGGAASLLAMNAFYPFFLIALPSTPIFGGTKHWMNGLPFLCVLAAWVVLEGCTRLEAVSARWDRAKSFALVAVLVLVPGFWITVRAHPYGLSSYNELVGFARGAANVGFQRTFWGYEPRAALPLINERTPKSGRIHFGDTNNDDHRMYRRDGLLRSDIGVTGTVRGADVASVQPQGEFKQQWMDVWNEWGKRSPEEVLTIDGVPLLTVTFEP